MQTQTATEQFNDSITGFLYRPIRSHQVDNRTGLTLNGQRRLNTVVARGAAFLDVALPGWHRKKSLVKGDLQRISYNMQALFENAGYMQLTDKALDKGLKIAKAHRFGTSHDEIDGSQFGSYPTEMGSEYRKGLGLAWTKAITTRLQADTERRLAAKLTADVL